MLDDLFILLVASNTVLFLQQSLTQSKKTVSKLLSGRGMSLNILEKCSPMVLLTSSLSEISSPLGDIKVSIVQL